MGGHQLPKTAKRSVLCNHYDFAYLAETHHLA